MSPLSKRLPREFRSNLGKWLGIIVLLVLTISLVAGFLMAATSIHQILDASDATYDIEDARLTCSFKMGDDAVQTVESHGVDVYENFSYDVALIAHDSSAEMSARVHKVRQAVDRAAYFEGTAPTSADQIALDRVFCSNHGIRVGDVVRVAGHDMTVSGIMSLSDYQALFQKNTDFVFNAQTFTTAELSDEGFALMDGQSCSYTYSLVMRDKGLDDAARTDLEQDIMDALKDKGVVVTDFVDKSANNGIGYAKDDVEGDTLMWTVMLYLMVVILAFVFVVLTSSTIDAESAVIGTLLASGYRKRELLAHYIALPMASGIVGAALGNILGYAFCIDAMSGLYYNSYSLPPYHTIWDWGVFFQSTLLPLAILFVVTLVGLARKLRCTPLQFLRRETSKRSRKGGHALPASLRFQTRFRLRVFGRNLSSFSTLFVGILFASLLLLFGFCLLPTVDHYAESLAQSLVSAHAYTLKTPLELDGTPEQRQMYAAALRLADGVDMSRVNKDEVKDLMASYLEDKVADGVRGQVEDRFNESALERIVRGKVEGLLDEDALQQTVTSRLTFDPSPEKLAGLVAQGADIERLGAATSDPGSLSQDDLALLVEAGIVGPRYVSLDDYGLGTVDILDDSGAGLDGIDAAGIDWGALVDDGIMRSSTIDLTYWGLGRIDLASGADLSAQLDSVDAQNLPWDRLVRSGILTSSVVDLSNYGLGEVDLATFDADNISFDDIDFATFDVDALDFGAIGLGSLDLGGMSRREFFELLQQASKIDEDAHVVNTQENSPEAIASAEKYVASQLEFARGGDNGFESVTLYGIMPNSRYYTDLTLPTSGIVAGRGLMAKFGLHLGDTVELFDKYENATYRLPIEGVWGNDGTMSVYMPLGAANELLGKDADFFSGYLSDEPLALDERYVAGDLTPDQMDKIASQMQDSMGGMMGVFVGVAVAVYVVLMYLLTKTVIEHNARAISYMKVFGYRTREINRLYLRSISQTVVVSLVVAIPIVVALIVLLVKVVFMRYNGNFVVTLPYDRLLLEIALGLACYALVAVVHARRIRRVPLALALKVQE